MTRPIVVLGGTGFVGHAVCEQLARQMAGVPIIVPTRRARFGLPVQSLPGVQLPVVDVLSDETALRRVLEGAQAVVNLIAVLHGDAARFEAVHAAFPRRLAAACADAGLARLVHVSALAVAPDAPSLYLRSKAAGEAALRSPGPVNAAILRPSVIFGARDRFTNLFARLQGLAPLMPLAGADARFQPVWVDDVARAVVRCLQQPGAAGRTWECCGPQVYTLAELVRLCGRIAGHERPVLPLPWAVGRLQAGLMSLLPGEPLMSRDNLDSMRVPSVASPGAPGLADLGIRPRSMEAVLPTYLGRLQPDGRVQRWRSER